MGEKPRRSAASDIALDPETLSIGNEALRSFRLIDPKTFSIAKQAAKGFGAGDRMRTASLIERLSPMEAGSSPPSIMRAATVALDSSRLVGTAALSQALTEINKTNAFRISEAVRAMNEANVVRISEVLRGIGLTPSLRAGIAETLKTLDFPASFRSQVADALAQHRGPLAADLQPRFERAAGEAVVLADTPAVRERVDQSVGDLDYLSSASLRELKADVANATALVLALVAIFADDERIDIASLCLGLAAVLISIYWRVTGKLNA